MHASVAFCLARSISKLPQFNWYVIGDDASIMKQLTPSLHAIRFRNRSARDISTCCALDSESAHARSFHCQQHGKHNKMCATQQSGIMHAVWPIVTPVNRKSSDKCTTYASDTSPLSLWHIAFGARTMSSVLRQLVYCCWCSPLWHAL